MSIGLILVGVGVFLGMIGAIVSVFDNKEKKVISYSNYDYSTKIYHSPQKYSISQSDFESIVHKCAKRIHRIENVEVDGRTVLLTIESQSGISTWNAQIIFALAGSADFIGDYTVFSDNEGSNIPESLGKRIKVAILEEVGIL